MTLAPEPWVWLARIRRPQGRKGEVFAELLTDFPQKFTDRRRLWLLPEDPSSSTRAGAPGPGSPRTGLRPRGGDPSHLGTRETRPIDPQARQVDLINHWLHKSGVVLHFAGVDSISAAEALAGLIVAIPRAERAALPADEAYIGDLIGCTLVDVTGAVPVPVGEIVDVDLSAGRPLGTAPLLIVRGPAGEILIPFAKSYLRRIDVAGKRIEMALPEGLIDLNVPEEP
jgi:16S rRNA processing protein RimM